MTLEGCLDALAVHAQAAADAVDTSGKFNDVAVRFPAAKGRSVDVFYAGERDSVYFGEGSLNSQHIAQSVGIRAMWPLPETAAKRQRAMEIEMGSFAAQLRTRVNADFQLGGNCTALKMLPGEAQKVMEAQKKYAAIEWEIGIDLDDYPQSP